MITFIKSRSGIFISDLAIILALYFLPGIAHLLPIPLYLLEPMRMAALTAYLLNRNFPNAMVIAITIPLFSVLTTGHPVWLKALLISFELAVNVILLHRFLTRYRFNTYLSIFSSVVVSKVFYYLMKFFLLTIGLLSGKLVSSSLWPQLYLALGLTLIFGRLLKLTNKYYQND